MVQPPRRKIDHLFPYFLSSWQMAVAVEKVLKETFVLRRHIVSCPIQICPVCIPIYSLQKQFLEIIFRNRWIILMNGTDRNLDTC